MPDSLLTEIEVANHLHVSVTCVRRRRLERRGPRFLKIGALVRYRPEDVEDWINARPAGDDNNLVARAPAAVCRLLHARRGLSRRRQAELDTLFWEDLMAIYKQKESKKTGGTNSIGTAG
jgi:predicted DNA-binding transcriptional regulator AlpA